MSTPFSNIAEYALQGSSCQANGDTVTSNTKFFPLKNPLYKVYYTYMYQYPGHVQERFYEPKCEQRLEKIQKCCGR